MRYLLILALTGLFTINALAGNGSGNVSSVFTFGVLSIPESQVSENVATNYFVITATNADGATSAYVYQFYRNGVAYKAGDVNAGKPAYCVQMGMAMQSTADSFQLMYGDNAFGNNVAVGTVTNPIYETGRSTGYPHQAVSTTESFQPITFKIPNGKYPGVQSAVNVFFVKLLCKEV